MTSPIADKHIQLQTGIGNLYSNNDSVMSSYACTAPGNLSYAHCNNNSSSSNINNNCSSSITNNSGSNESSHLLTLSMLNQVLNINQDRLSIPSLQFPEIQKMSDNNIGNTLNPTLITEYQRIKQAIDKSGLLTPNENLVTKNRGECYWSNCCFQSDIEETFKKHLTDSHQLTSSALAQLDLSLEKSIQLSKMLLKEQNHLYNMMLHLDQKLKSLPGECNSLSDFHYLSLLLSKFKQSPTLFDGAGESNQRLATEMPSLHSSQQLPLYTGNHLGSLHQHTPNPISKPVPNFPQQFIDNLSTALLRQQQQHQHQPQTLSMSSIPLQNGNYHQPLYSQNHSFTTGGIVPVTLKSEQTDSNAILYSNGGKASSPNVVANSSHQFTNVDTNLKDILSQPRSSDSNYARSESALSTHVKEKKIKGLRRTPSGEQGQQLSKNMTDREYYRQFAVRPSASYVNLIKTAILESAKRELSLNEIYVWMQTEFAYFRDKEQKWKNAIRHNLSLHKCFQRKHGKLWTFNENEYNLKKSRNRFQYNVPISGSEIPNADVDCYDEDDDGEETPEEPDNHGSGGVKKELDDMNDENMPDHNHQHQHHHMVVLDNDEWSNYLHKNSLKVISNSATGSDISMLPNLRCSSATTATVIDN